ncbi:MAG: leucine-rich repeat domain-containing protein [Oscillospiraceae bacterium]|nr:leucine-rich repeat domain-containing protein [Oscillospiraceae bacterium]
MYKCKNLLAVLVCAALTLTAAIMPVSADTRKISGFLCDIYSDHIEISGYEGYDTNVVVPGQLLGLPVTTVGKYAFQYGKNELNETITSITLPETVTRIGERAFEQCKGLTGIKLPGGLKGINYGAFYGCEGLTEITIPGSVEYIGEGAFEACSSLTTLVVENGVTTIYNSAFWRCTSLADIVLPDSVTSIGFGVFTNTAYYNDKANWTDNVLYVGNHLVAADGVSGDYSVRSNTVTIAGNTFRGCTQLTGVTIPNSLIGIGQSAFNGCSSLRSIDIPNSVQTVGIYAFQNCSSLEKVTLGKNVQSIGQNTFDSCESLKSIDIPDSVQTIGNNAFLWCRSLESVNMGNGVETIGKSAFDNCWALTNLNMGSSVVSIGSRAFNSCAFADIELPVSLKIISESAFRSCDDLTDVYYGGSEQDWSMITIGNYNEPLLDAKIHYNSSRPIEDPKVEGSKVEGPHIIDVTIGRKSIDVRVSYKNVPPSAKVFAVGYGEDDAFLCIADFNNGTAVLPPEGVTKVKVMIWSSFDSMLPIAAADSLDL